jgi:hypothetical protein
MNFLTLADFAGLAMFQTTVRNVQCAAAQITCCKTISLDVRVQIINIFGSNQLCLF